MTKRFYMTSLLALAVSACGVKGSQNSTSHVTSVGKPTTASDLHIVKHCLADAVEKLKQKALPCSIDPAAVKATAIDNRWYNPSAYVWYETKATCDLRSQKDMTVMIQYYQGECL
jgi:hypothetical protein